MVVPGFKAHGPFKEQSDGQYLGDLMLPCMFYRALPEFTDCFEES